MVESVANERIFNIINHINSDSYYNKNENYNKNKNENNNHSTSNEIDKRICYEDEIETPSLMVDLDEMEENIAMMRKIVYEDLKFSGKIRTHSKMHKSADISLLLHQSFASNSAGICCQKTEEAVRIIDVTKGKIDDVLISNEVVDVRKIRRLFAFAKRYNVNKLKLVVDNIQMIDVIANCANDIGMLFPVGILIDINVGGNRCGVDADDVETSLEMVKRISSLSSLPLHNNKLIYFAGIQGYQGSAQHIRSYADRANASRITGEIIQKHLSFLNNNYFNANNNDDKKLQEQRQQLIITGGGTGSFIHDIECGVLNEIQPGSFLFYDVDYSKNMDANNNILANSIWKNSLYVLTSVMSVNYNAKLPRVVVDAGQKCISVDSGPPKVKGRNDLKVVNGGDEHMIIFISNQDDKTTSRSTNSNFKPKIGDKIKLIPGHCDPTVNMHNQIFGVRRDKSSGKIIVERIFKLDGRGVGY